MIEILSTIKYICSNHRVAFFKFLKQLLLYSTNIFYIYSWKLLNVSLVSFYAFLSYPFQQYQYVMIHDEQLQKFPKKMVQHVSSMQSVKVRTTLGPGFSFLLSFLPKYKSNWYRYPALLAQQDQNVNHCFIVLILTYLFMLVLPLNLNICSLRF